MIEQVKTQTLSDGERLAVVENNIHNLKESQTEIKDHVSLIQKEVSELSGLIKVNNSLLLAMSEDMKRVKDRTDFMPKAVLTAVVTLAVGLVFSQGTLNVISDKISPASATSAVVQSKPRLEPESIPSQDEDPEDEAETQETE